jgi:hypothetical protein
LIRGVTDEDVRAQFHLSLLGLSTLVENRE